MKSLIMDERFEKCANDLILFACSQCHPEAIGEIRLGKELDCYRVLSQESRKWFLRSVGITNEDEIGIRSETCPTLEAIEEFVPSLPVFAHLLVNIPIVVW